MSGLASTDSISAVSSTLRPMGPEVDSGKYPMPRVLPGTTPGDGRYPTTPQKAAGLRSDPPVSDPVAKGKYPAANPAADPPEDPAQVRVRSYGLAVAP